MLFFESPTDKLLRRIINSIIGDFMKETDDVVKRSITQNVQELFQEDARCETSDAWLIYKYWQKFCGLGMSILVYEETKRMLDNPDTILRVKRTIMYSRRSKKFPEEGDFFEKIPGLRDGKYKNGKDTCSD